MSENGEPNVCVPPTKRRGQAYDIAADGAGRVRLGRPEDNRTGVQR
jgi:hypothetical protein